MKSPDMQTSPWIWYIELMLRHASYTAVASAQLLQYLVSGKRSEPIIFSLRSTTVLSSGHCELG